MTSDELRALAEKIREAARYAHMSAEAERVQVTLWRETCEIQRWANTVEMDLSDCRRLIRLADNLAIAGNFVQVDPTVTTSYVYGIAFELGGMASELEKQRETREATT